MYCMSSIGCVSKKSYINTLIIVLSFIYKRMDINALPYMDYPNVDNSNFESFTKYKL